MQTNIFFILCIQLCIIYSCSNITKNKSENKKESYEVTPLISNDSIIVVDLDNAIQTELLYLSSLIKNVHVVPLETKGEILIGRINKLLIHNNQLFILDMTFAKSLFVFNKDGSFSHKIGSIGKGPGEYINISDFSIDTKNNVIYILDSHSQKVNLHDTATGKYIKSVKIKNDFFRSFRLQFVDGKLYTDVHQPLGASDNCFLLRVINTETGEQEACWMPSSQYNKGWTELFFKGHNEFITHAQDAVKFKQLFMDTVVMITPVGVTPYMVIKTKNLLTTEDLQKTAGMSADVRYQSLLNVNKIYGINDYLEVEKYIFFNFKKLNSIFRVLYNKTDKSTSVYKAIIDNMVYSHDRAITISPNFYHADNKGIYGILQPQETMRFLEIAQKGYLSAFMTEKHKTVKFSEESNPVIFFYEFKD